MDVVKNEETNNFQRRDFMKLSVAVLAAVSGMVVGIPLIHRG